MTKQIKLSLYIKRNRPYILRNCFFDLVNDNKDVNTFIADTINYIRDLLISGCLESDIDIKNAFRDLRNYVQDNVLNYIELKRIFLFDIKHIVSPKPTYKQYINDNIKSAYYKNILLNQSRQQRGVQQ